MANLHIQQWGNPVPAVNGTVLDAALKSGVPYPHGCRSGKCGNCKTRLIEGEVDHSAYFKEALSDKERADGMILACCAKPKGDIRVAWSGAAATVSIPVRKLTTRVIGLERLAPDVTAVRLTTRGKALEFAAGQYARLRFGNHPARSYSMANRPGSNELEFHIRHVPDGRISGFVATGLRVGDKVKLEGPFGSAHLRSDHDGPIIAVGGGTGLAPMLSIVRTSLAEKPHRAIHLYFGVRNEIDVYAKSILDELAHQYPSLNVQVILSAASPGTNYRVGLVHNALVHDQHDLAAGSIYTAGPMPMVDAIKRVALDAGLSEANVHCDPFVASAEETSNPLGQWLGKVREMFLLQKPSPQSLTVSEN